MPVRDRGARERFMRQSSFSGSALPGATLFHHHPAARRSSVHDAAALRHRRRSTLRRQAARELIAEEEETVPVGDPNRSIPTEPPKDCDMLGCFFKISNILNCGLLQVSHGGMLLCP